MPVVTWRGHDGPAEVEEGTVKVLLKSLFVDGVKRRRLVDLAGLPERSSCALTLHFSERDSCEIRFEKDEQCDVFETQVQEATGQAKRKLTSVMQSSRGDVSRSRGNDGVSISNTKTQKSQVHANKADSVVPGWEKAVKAAVASAQISGGPFVNPFSKIPPLVQANATLATGMTEAAQLLAAVCAAWESMDAQRKRCQQDHASRLPEHAAGVSNDADRSVIARLNKDLLEANARLLGAEELAETYRKTGQFLEKENAALTRRLDEFESQGLSKMRDRNQFLEGEVAKLRQRLVEETGGGRRTAAAAPPQTAQSIAQLEGEPLQHCSAEDREGLKKKLLLKWHPDKQPSAFHAEIATKVMQELQNLKEWRI